MILHERSTYEALRDLRGLQSDVLKNIRRQPGVHAEEAVSRRRSHVFPPASKTLRSSLCRLQSFETFIQEIRVVGNDRLHTIFGYDALVLRGGVRSQLQRSQSNILDRAQQ